MARRPFTALLALLALLALAGCGSQRHSQDGGLITTGTSTSATPPQRPRLPVKDGPSTAAGPGPQLTVVLHGADALTRLHLAAFASLASAAGKPLGTQPLGDGPVYYKVSPGSYRLTITFSPCQGDCRVFHGGTTLTPLLIQGKASTRVVVTPACAPTPAGLDCSASKISR